MLDHLADMLREQGYDCQVAGAALPLRDLGLELRVEDPVGRTGENPAAFHAVVRICGSGDTGEGIRVLAASTGPDLAGAKAGAALQWVSGVLPALESYFGKGARRDQVERRPLLVETAEQGERFGWMTHLPPVLALRYGGSGPMTLPGQSDVFHALFESIHPTANHRDLFWVEAFAARHADGRVDATCRWCNEPFPEGQQALLDWARTWSEDPGTLLTKRQFLLFEPRPADAPEIRALAGHLPDRRPWWKRLLGWG